MCSYFFLLVERALHNTQRGFYILNRLIILGDRFCMSKKQYNSICVSCYLFIREQRGATKTGISKHLLCTIPSVIFFRIVSGVIHFVVLGRMSRQLIRFMRMYVVTTWVDTVFCKKRLSVSTLILEALTKNVLTCLLNGLRNI